MGKEKWPTGHARKVIRARKIQLTRRLLRYADAVAAVIFKTRYIVPGPKAATGVPPEVSKHVGQMGQRQGQGGSI